MAFTFDKKEVQVTYRVRDALEKNGMSWIDVSICLADILPVGVLDGTCDPEYQDWVPCDITDNIRKKAIQLKDLGHTHFIRTTSGTHISVIYAGDLPPDINMAGQFRHASRSIRLLKRLLLQAPIHKNRENHPYQTINKRSDREWYLEKILQDPEQLFRALDNSGAIMSSRDHLTGYEIPTTRTWRDVWEPPTQKEV